MQVLAEESATSLRPKFSLPERFAGGGGRGRTGAGGDYGGGGYNNVATVRRCMVPSVAWHASSFFAPREPNGSGSFGGKGFVRIILYIRRN